MGTTTELLYPSDSTPTKCGECGRGRRKQSPHLISQIIGVDLGSDHLSKRVKIAGVLSWVYSRLSIMLLLGYNIYLVALDFSWI